MDVFMAFFELFLVLALFLAFMVYRIVVICRGSGGGVVVRKPENEIRHDGNVLYDPAMRWHPLNYYHRR